MGFGSFGSGAGDIAGNLSVTGTATITGDLTVDTNTLFVDASANRVGIGTTNLDSALHVQTPNSHCSITLERSEKATGQVGLDLNGGTDGKFWYLTQLASSDNLTFHDTDAARVTFEHGGNVGIGTATFDSTAAGYLTIANGTSPAAHTDNQTYIGSLDVAADGASLALFTEEAVAAEAIAAADRSLKVTINGAIYKLMLEYVSGE
jgi:phage gp45-like